VQVETMVVVEEDDMVVEAHVRYAAQSHVSSLLLGSVYLLSSGSKSDNRAEQRRHAILPASLAAT
jgi:TPP-dependent indolepyruvate ferredoxin oxidoreductase alpha subunit